MTLWTQVRGHSYNNDEKSQWILNVSEILVKMRGPHPSKESSMEISMYHTKVSR